MLHRILAKGNRWLDRPMEQWLLASCLFSCVLLGTRILVTGYHTYLFLTWNLFLAFVPYAISRWLYSHAWLTEQKLKLAGILLIWLAFIPNSFYIITDLFHLDRFDEAPKWFDLLLIFSFAWNGLLLGMISVRKTEQVLVVMLGRNFTLVLLVIVMWLNAFGIYIGRYLRYNSWDILVQPLSLFGEMKELVLHPLRYKMEWGMISIYALFMTLCYLTVMKLGEHFLKHNLSTNK
jgi:uncharacterized membrane protein